MAATTSRSEPLEYFATPGPPTDLKKHASALPDLPASMADLGRVVQGLVAPSPARAAYEEVREARAAPVRLELDHR